MPDAPATLGLYGLGTMGSALALNILEKGFALHVSNRSADTTRAFVAEAKAEGLADRLTGHDSLVEMVRAMPAPRAIILMVPAGAPVDDTIAELLPELAPGDTIIDGGNSDFHDTRRRTADLEARGFTFIGMGVSGGEAGARHGPSIMVGGTRAAWEAIAPVIRAIAAKYQGDPCADHLGPDGAGHFVKTVHNGIEYADMEVLAEAYGLMRYGQDRAPAEIAQVFERWAGGPLASYLVEITAKVLAATDPETGEPVVDVIVDSAGQKGTGRWTVVEAVKLGQSASAIEAAVGVRAWSAERVLRARAATAFGAARGPVDLPEETLHDAVLAARIVAYAQGFRILAAASDEYDWGVDHARVAEIWRAGCIIRSALLDDIAAAFRADPPLGQLVLDRAVAEKLKATIPALRATVAAAVAAGQPVPALSAALQWLDEIARARGTTDLIQAQRDFFGRHGFQRLDGRENQHGPWWDDA